MKRILLLVTLIGLILVLTGCPGVVNNIPKIGVVPTSIALIGGVADDRTNSIQQTSDGGYVVAGSTESNTDNPDWWIVKLTADGTITWEKCLGGSSSDYAYSIQQTSDGGYVVAGITNSDDGDFSENHGNFDCWIVKLTADGTIIWEKCLGSSSNDIVNSIQQTSDGGYIVAGCTESNAGEPDWWIVKLTVDGTITWENNLGGSGYDEAKSIQQTSDGGYVVAGITYSNDGDVSGYHGGCDWWIVKLTADGTITWENNLGGSGYDEAKSIQQTTDSGYIVAGYTSSSDGDVSGNHGEGDYWIVKLTNDGTITWDKCLGGSSDDYAHSVQQTSDGGYVVAGSTHSTDGDISGNHGHADYWIVKLTKDGTVVWDKCLGGALNDYARGIQQISDGGYVVAGNTYSNDGDVSGYHGGCDCWIVKLTEEFVY